MTCANTVKISSLNSDGILKLEKLVSLFEYITVDVKISGINYWLLSAYSLLNFYKFKSFQK